MIPNLVAAVTSRSHELHSKSICKLYAVPADDTVSGYQPCEPVLQQQQLAKFDIARAGPNWKCSSKQLNSCQESVLLSVPPPRTLCLQKAWLDSPSATPRIAAQLTRCLTSAFRNINLFKSWFRAPNRTLEHGQKTSDSKLQDSRRPIPFVGFKCTPDVSRCRQHRPLSDKSSPRIV